MITPADIQHKEFTRGVRGYKEDEVDKFLDLITLDLDNLVQENKLLHDKVSGLTAEIERYRNSESAIFSTLESAKALMGDISASAEKRAEIVLKNAELDAENIRREARESVERITDEAEDMARRWEQFKMRYHSLLQNEIERFDTLSGDLVPPASPDRTGFYADYTTSDRKNSQKSGVNLPDSKARTATKATTSVAAAKHSDRPV